MANHRVNGDPKATDDLYSLSQYADDRYIIWHSCIVNGVRFRCKERDDKFKTQCSGVCTGGDYESSDITYYGVQIKILELDFIYQRMVFMFRCKWYNTDPKGKRIVVNNNLTSLDITSNWYAEDPFILATQAQQVFYLNDRSRGKNWMVVQKVNHRNINDIVEHDDDKERVSDDIFQVDTSFLVRQNEEPITLPHELVIKLRSEQAFLNDQEQNLEDIEDFDDDGRFFITDKVTLESKTDDDSDDYDLDDDVDDDA